MLRNVVLFLLLVGSSIAGAMANQPPRFVEYPTAGTFSGVPVPVLLESEAEKSYRTRLRAATATPANFASDHVITTWGCGTTCLHGAAVSLRTGKVTFLPGTACCWKGEGNRIEFRTNSRLLVLAGLINEEGTHGAHFYEFTGNSFRLIKTIAVSEPEDTPSPPTSSRSNSSADWMSVATSTNMEWHFQASSFAISKNKGGQAIFLITGKRTDSRTKKIDLFKTYVSISDCKRRLGKIVFLNIDDEFQYENDFVFGSGSVATGMAEEICNAGLSIQKSRNNKSV